VARDWITLMKKAYGRRADPSTTAVPWTRKRPAVVMAARILATVAAAAGRTHTFIGARHRRIKRRRGTLKALVATSRAILEIIWTLPSNPAALCRELGEDH
jgi:hypothetical protein